MRILHTESSMGLGGQEYRILIESEGMKKRGHSVTIAAPSESQLARLAHQQGLPVRTMPSGIRGWMTAIPWYGWIIRHGEIDVINTHGSQDSWTASLAGRLSSRRPVIIRTRHKSTPVSPSLRHQWLYGTLPHLVTTTGDAVRQAFITRNRLDPSRVVSIPTGVDTRRFYPRRPDESLYRSLGLRPQDPLVGAVTFLRPEKGMDTFLESMRLLKKTIPHVQGLIVGDGQERDNLLIRRQELGLEECVHMVGFRHDIPALLALLQVVVIPSMEEGIPQSLTQALAMERPVVASAVGGVPEVVEDGVTGVLVPPRNPAMLADKIAFLLQHSSVGLQMGKAGRQVIQERYSLEWMLDQTEQVYRRLLPPDRAGV